MLLIKIALTAISVLVVAQTAASLVKTRVWWVRVFDFPRAQIALSSTILLALFGVANLGLERATWWEWVLFFLLAGSVFFQVRQMLPYTRFWRADVLQAPSDAPRERRLRIAVSNVCMENRDFKRWRQEVLQTDPDLVVAVEVDPWWDRQLRAIEEDYPFRICHPQDNTYGMSVYSKLPLQRKKIRFLIERDVPSIFTLVELRAGRKIWCVVLHPRPPRPDIQQHSDLRDAELARVGQIVRQFKSPTIVMGDLNDVAWSHTTHLFQRIAGLLDPRVGRGRFSTYHADRRILRYPLDHVFHSRDFDLVELRRLKHVGSDHFPILIELALRADQQDRPEPNRPTEQDEEDALNAVQDVEQRLSEETTGERRERHQADQ